MGCDERPAAAAASLYSSYQSKRPIAKLLHCVDFVLNLVKMSTGKRKQTALDLDAKIAIINEIEAGKKQTVFFFLGLGFVFYMCTALRLHVSAALTLLLDNTDLG
jgi:hypothetical protein